MKKTKRIKDFLNEIDWLFNLNNFDKVITLAKEDEIEKTYSNTEIKVTCKICYDDIYQRIEIVVYPYFFRHDLPEQRRILLHELCHSLTLPSRTLSEDLLDGQLVTHKQIIDTNEKMTSKFECILDGLLRDRFKYTRDAYAEYIEKPKKKKKKKNA